MHSDAFSSRGAFLRASRALFTTSRASLWAYHATGRPPSRLFRWFVRYGNDPWFEILISMWRRAVATVTCTPPKWEAAPHEARAAEGEATAGGGGGGGGGRHSGGGLGGDAEADKSAPSWLPEAAAAAAQPTPPATPRGAALRAAAAADNGGGGDEELFRDSAAFCSAVGAASAAAALERVSVLGAPSGATAFEERGLKRQAKKRRLTVFALASVALVWVAFAWVILTYGVLISSQLGSRGLDDFTTAYGVSVGVEMASKWWLVVASTALMVMFLVGDRFLLTPHDRWLEEHIDYLSLRAMLFAHAGRLSWLQLSRAFYNQRKRVK